MTHQRSVTAPLFVWDVQPHGDAPQVSAGGVTDDKGLACWHVFWLLASSPPGTRGVVRPVALDPMHPSQYREAGEASEAWHDPDTGGIAWTGAPAAPVDWLETKLAEARAVIRASSPGQFAAWWAAFRSRGAR